SSSNSPSVDSITFGTVSHVDTFGTVLERTFFSVFRRCGNCMTLSVTLRRSSKHVDVFALCRTESADLLTIGWYADCKGFVICTNKKSFRQVAPRLGGVRTAGRFVQEAFDHAAFVTKVSRYTEFLLQFTVNNHSVVNMFA
ncbi:hypothetical protein CLF_110577, partial [Clonorchis sinensis]